MLCKDPPIYSKSPVEDIKVKIEITKNIGQFYTFTAVYLYDSKNRSIVLEDGNIEVNNIKMNEPYWDLFGHKTEYYTLYSLELKENEKLTFNFNFASGETYSAWIRLPAVEINKIIMPDSISENTKLTVAWEPVDYQFPQKLSLKYLAETAVAKNKIFILESPYKGTFEIDENLIRYTDVHEFADAECTIRLVSETSGVFDDSFADNCTIEAKFIIEKSIKVLDY